MLWRDFFAGLLDIWNRLVLYYAFSCRLVLDTIISPLLWINLLLILRLIYGEVHNLLLHSDFCLMYVEMISRSLNFNILIFQLACKPPKMIVFTTEPVQAMTDWIHGYFIWFLKPLYVFLNSNLRIKCAELLYDQYICSILRIQYVCKNRENLSFLGNKSIF